MALSLWDHVTYLAPRDMAIVLRKYVLPLFRGVALFFLDYFYRPAKKGDRASSGDDTPQWLHTGPTTSPETSYTLKSKGAAQQQQQDGKQKRRSAARSGAASGVELAFSPAIDCSVLRQV